MGNNISTCVSQIAFSVANLEKTTNFYKNVFQLYDSGGTRAFRKRLPKKVQGIKGLSSLTHWLQDDFRKFQLEFFQFSNNPPRIPKDWKPYDMGMTRFAVEVRNLDHTLQLAKENQASSVSEPIIIEGSHYATVRDPDGILIELKENTAMTCKCPTNVCGVAYSVPDFDGFVTGLKKALLFEEDKSLFVDKHPLLQIEGAERKVTVLNGHKCWIEISQYKTPIPKPLNQNYLLTDIGLSHIAITCATADEFINWYDNYITKVFRPNSPRPMGFGKMNMCMYTVDPWRFVFETVYMNDFFGGIFGFAEQRGFKKFIMKALNVIGL